MMEMNSFLMFANLVTGELWMLKTIYILFYYFQSCTMLFIILFILQFQDKLLIKLSFRKL